MIRFLRACLIFARCQAYCPASDWTAEDGQRLLTFLTGITGRRLSAILLNMAMRQQASAVVSGNNLHYQCGYATGFKGAIAMLQSLVPAPVSTEEQDPDLPVNLDHLSP